MAAPAASSAAPAPPLMTGPNAASQLASLPGELLSNIAARLGSDDLFSLRLTCRDVEAKCLHEFAQEYFSSKCFMLTSASLNTLVNIAKSSKLKGKLHTVSIITASFPDRSATCSHGSCCCWQPTVRQREASLFYTKDQEELRKTKRDRALLTEAFRNLPDLRHLSLVDHIALIPAPLQTIWGLNKVLRTTAKSPTFAPVNDQPHFEYYTFLSHVWITMLQAVVNSGLNTLTTFETQMKSHMHGISPVSDLRFKQETLSKLAVCFANVQTVGIRFRSQFMRKNFRADTESDLSKATAMVKAFTPVFKSANSVQLSSDFLDWSGVLAITMINALDMKALKNVTFDSIYVDGKTLGSAISQLTSVEKLVFHAIDLNSSSWVTILKILQKLPKLDHLHLQLLQQATQKVYFLQQPEDDEDGDPAVADPAWMGGGRDDEDEDWTEEDSDGSDDEPPGLIPQTQVDDMPGSETHTDVQPVVPEKPANKCLEYTGKDFKARGCDDSPERGYYVCLATREDIEEQLPNFIADCNLGESYDDMGMNGLNGLLAMAGLPPNAVGGGIAGGAGAGAGAGPPLNNNNGPPPNGPLPGGQNPVIAALDAMLGLGGPPPQIGPNGISFSLPIGPPHHHLAPNPAPGPAPPGNTGQTPAQPQAAPGASNVPPDGTTPGSAPAAAQGGSHQGGQATGSNGAFGVTTGLGGVPDLWMSDEVESGWMDDVD